MLACGAETCGMGVRTKRVQTCGELGGGTLTCMKTRYRGVFPNWCIYGVMPFWMGSSSTTSRRNGSAIVSIRKTWYLSIARMCGMLPATCTK